MSSAHEKLTHFRNSNSSGPTWQRSNCRSKPFTARSPSGSADSGRESAEPLKLQLVLDPEYRYGVSDTVANTLNTLCANPDYS